MNPPQHNPSYKESTPSHLFLLVGSTSDRLKFAYSVWALGRLGSEWIHHNIILPTTNLLQVTYSSSLGLHPIGSSLPIRFGESRNTSRYSWTARAIGIGEFTSRSICECILITPHSKTMTVPDTTLQCRDSVTASNLCNFLTNGECKHIQSSAEANGMTQAETVTKDDAPSRWNCQVAWLNGDVSTSFNP
jgi:hypothetical protein